MTRRLIACSECSEMVLEGSCVCAHCGYKYPCRSKRLSAAALMMGLTVALTGCAKYELLYGAAGLDIDNDGYDDYHDCDDNDPKLNLDDADMDGFSTCYNDCDDDNAELNPADDDGDGFSTCDGDCDDLNELAYPEAEEIIGDGVDSNCDGEDDT